MKNNTFWIKEKKMSLQGGPLLPDLHIGVLSATPSLMQKLEVVLFSPLYSNSPFLCHCLCPDDTLIPRLQKFDYHLFYLSCWSSAPKPHKEWPSHSGTHHIAQRRFFVLASSHCSSLKTEPVYFLTSGKHLLHVEVNWVTPGQVNEWICYSDLLLISNCAKCLCTGFLQSLTSKEVADGGTGATVCTPLLT